MRRDVAKGLFAAPYAPGRSQGLFDERGSKRLSGPAGGATVNVSHLSVAGQRYRLLETFNPTPTIGKHAVRLKFTL
jgi:hypothetical protein